MCTIAVAIKELYGSHDYDDKNIVTITGGGDEYQIVMDFVLIYITRQKMTYARFLSDMKNSKDPQRQLLRFINGYECYFDKPLKYILKKITHESEEILQRVFLQTVDMIAIAEQMCSTYVDASLPSTLPAYCEVSLSYCDDITKVIEHVNTVIDYANKLFICGIKLDNKIDLMVNDLPLVRFPDIPFVRKDVSSHNDHTKEILDMDISIAEYASKVEKVHFNAVIKLTLVIKLCQKIMDKLISIH